MTLLQGFDESCGAGKGQGLLPNPAQGWLLGWRMHRHVIYAKGLCSTHFRGVEQEIELRKPSDFGTVFRPQKQTVVSDNKYYSVGNCSCFSTDPCHHCMQTAHGVHIWCWAPYPTCVLLGHFLTTLQCCRDVMVLRLKCCLDVKNTWKTLRVPPAACHCCVGLAPCLLRGFSTAKCNGVPGPESHRHFPQQPWLHVSKVSCVPEYLYSLVLWHCFEAVTLAVWSQTS